jgi:hypothetical protein
MSEVPRRPLLQSLPAALFGAALGGRTTAAASGRPVTDGGPGAPAGAGVDPARTSVRTLTRERTTEVQSGDRDEATITAPSGSVLELQAVAVSVDPVEPANAGRHVVEVGLPETDLVVVRGVASDNRSLWFDGTGWRAADRETTPGDETAQLLAARGLLVDDERGITVEYRNETNSVQTSPRTVQAWVVEYAPPDRADDAGEGGTDADGY